MAGEGSSAGSAVRPAIRVGAPSLAIRCSLLRCGYPAQEERRDDRQVRTRGVTAATVGCLAVASLAGAAGAAGPRVVKVTIDDTGCPATLSAKAGPSTFVVTNKGTGGVTEFEIVSADASKILGEVENIGAGKKAEFTLSLKAGDYKTACPGGTVTSLGEAHRDRHRRHHAVGRRAGRGRRLPPVPRAADRRS